MIVLYILGWCIMSVVSVFFLTILNVGYGDKMVSNKAEEYVYSKVKYPLIRWCFTLVMIFLLAPIFSIIDIFVVGLTKED